VEIFSYWTPVVKSNKELDYSWCHKMFHACIGKDHTQISVSTKIYERKPGDFDVIITQVLHEGSM
jgi:hypothetical protein